MAALNGVRNLLFDLDGTLVDSRRTIVDSIRYALQKTGPVSASAGDVESLIGKPLLDIFTGHYGLDSDRALQAIDIYRDYYDSLKQAGTTVYEGVREGLAELNSGGYRLFLATVKPTRIAEKVLADLDLRVHFHGVAGASMGPERRKKTAIIAFALSEYGLDPASSLMIGDRDQDLDGARENGLPAIAVSWGFGGTEEFERARPAYRADRFEDVLSLLRRR
jgi:phosphoglycolate phosphatase